MEDNIYILTSSGELYHHGVKGMKWGVRRYQNPDGSLTAEGKKRLAKGLKKGLGTTSMYRAGSYNRDVADDLNRNYHDQLQKHIDNIREKKKQYLEARYDTSEIDAHGNKMVPIRAYNRYHGACWEAARDILGEYADMPLRKRMFDSYTLKAADYLAFILEHEDRMFVPLGPHAVTTKEYT